MDKYGIGYFGSTEIELSTANQEVIPAMVATVYVSAENGRCVFTDFSFVNTEVCHVKINDSLPIFLDAGQGFDSGSYINSFIIVEDGIHYNWIGKN